MRAMILILALAAATTPAAMATALSGLWNTGVNSSGDALASNGSVDSHFATNPGTYAVTYYASVYYRDQTNAAWITTASGQPPTNANAFGLYNYTEDLLANVSGSVTITGSWATDNCGSILVNGGAVTGTGTTIGGGANSNCSAANYSYWLCSRALIGAVGACGVGVAGRRLYAVKYAETRAWVARGRC